MILWYRAMLSRIHTSALNRHTSEKAVKHLIQCWTKKFDENQVPEAESSIKHIICSILGLRNAVVLVPSVLHCSLRCTAIDANPAAVSLSRLNSELLGLADRASFSIAKLEDDGVIHVFSPADSQKFDILVSNPPYIPTAEISGLQPEVFRYEDHLALDGGPDGTRLIETIIRNSPKWLRGGAFIVLEIDPRQTKMIQLISQDCGSYAGFSVRKDCFGVDRFVVLRCK
ncbi:release factor glutamine methyltransferase-like isoform X2 [Daphnia carinata]|uniref:release factor glutamine methyltransferase-like isoform X2 n=1 Tax=Daphnia carinata TaxID=120202 RepID=UPI00257F9EA7|nr:release factor glutamine methyltransferase-like isoform X2 [Daphnia carinata]